MKMIKCDNCGSVEKQMIFHIANVKGRRYDSKKNGAYVKFCGGMVVEYGDFCSPKCISEWFANWDKRQEEQNLQEGSGEEVAGDE